MNKNLNKANSIVSLVGMGVAFVMAIFVMITIMFEAEIPSVIASWLSVAVIATLIATIVMSVFSTKGLINKIAQICIAVGLLAILVTKILMNLDVNAEDLLMILTYVFAGMLIVGAILWIVTLFVKKFKSEQKAPYFFAFEMLVFGLTTLLAICGLIPGLMTSIVYMFPMRLLIGLICNFYYAMELSENSKAAFWFTVALFVAVSFPMAVAFSGII